MSVTCLMQHSAVDYVRMTWKQSGMRSDQFSNIWPKLHQVAQQAGNGKLETEDCKILGYIGNRCGPVFIGRGPEGGIIQASGHCAQLVCELGLQPDNVPRLDLQITQWYSSYDAAVALRGRDEAGVAHASRRGRKPARRYIDGCGDGDTLYLGSRGKKSVFIRVYDKEKESGDEVYESAWRYEAELTDQYAVDAYWNLMEAKFGEPMTARLVLGYLKMRGLELKVPDQAKAFDIARLPKEESSVERRLRWLETQVEPAIQRLLLAGVDPSDIRSRLGLL